MESPANDEGLIAKGRLQDGILVEDDGKKTPPEPGIPVKDVRVMVTELTKLTIREYNRRYIDKLIRLATEGLKGIFWVLTTLIIKYATEAS